MGRNAQKRRAKKLRDVRKDGADGRDRGPDVRIGPTTPDRPRGPLWLRNTIVSIAPTKKDPDADSLLDVALAAARNASLVEIARRVARITTASEFLISLTSDGAVEVGHAKRPGHESIPGLEALFTDELARTLDGPFIVENTASDPRLPSAPTARAHVGSFIALPLKFLGQRHGHIVASRREVGGFPSHDVMVLTAIADQLAQDLVQARALRVAWTDPLTGALSRQALFVLLEREIERARRDDTDIGIALIDIDGLQSVNERYGHAAGDKILIDVAARATALTRGAELCGRMGADKFLFILDGDLEETADAARRLLRDVMTAAVDVDGNAVEVRASIGLSSLAPQEDTLSLLARAESALLEAKANGGGTMVVGMAHADVVARVDDDMDESDAAGSPVDDSARDERAL